MRLKLAVVAALVVGLYVWTALTSESAPVSRVDPYNRLADAFAHGQLALRVTPDPGLLRLPDPYDPTQNGYYLHPDPDYVHDLSLYHGRLYAYWGPSPVLALFLPARLLGADYVPLAVAVLVFAIVAFLAAAALLVLLTRRLLPATPDWMLLAGVALVGLGSFVLFNLRRPAVYEASITAGMAFACVGLLLGALGLLAERPRWGLLAGASAAVGLAFGARPTLAPLAIGLVAAAVWLRSPRASMALLAPFGVCIAAYLTYNQARFGAPLQFGLHYQLVDAIAGGRPQVGGFFRPVRLLTGGWDYLVAPFQAALQFPYVFLRGQTADALGLGASAAEPTAGLLPIAPLLVVLFAAPWALRRAAPGLRVAVYGLALAGVACFALASVSVGVLTERYVADFATFLLLAAALTWFALGRRRWAAAAGGVLIAWTAIIATALSITGADARLQRLHPATFASLERFFSPLPTAIARLAGHPVLASTSADSAVAPSGGAVHVTPGAPVELRIVSGTWRRATIAATVSRGPAIPADVALVVEVAGRGARSSAPADGAHHRFAVQLAPGINRVAVRAIGSRPYFTQTDPPEAAQLRLDGLRIVPAG